ncbi:MAG: serine/threonine-protein phosphatase [Lachnospiraceae bacterium]|nr:serine/threonine-protein phosphatase [Lachnospiraceae bacterium]
MEFLSVAHSDVGIRKRTNQDSVLIKEASTDYGKVHLSVICDGMGGLAKGEVASATLIRAFSRWFEETLPFLLYEKRFNDRLDFNELQKSWNQLIAQCNDLIGHYGEACHAPCGTTAAAILMAEGSYYIANVGDSRVYILRRNMRSLTKDQTFVQREVDEGRMTVEEAAVHPQKNVLLQCVGASPVVVPDFYTGSYGPGDVFLLCSDGFRHVISEEEFMNFIRPAELQTEADMKDAAIYCTELNKQRRENDNISVILVKVME